MKKFKMKRANNGYVLETPDGDIVFQSNDYNEQNDVDRFIEFLHAIADNFGPLESRYGHKLRIVWIPGDKNDEEWAKMEECPVCYQPIKHDAE